MRAATHRTASTTDVAGFRGLSSFIFPIGLRGLSSIERGASHLPSKPTLSHREFSEGRIRKS